MPAIHRAATPRCGKVTSVQIAMNKAFTAAGHRKPTHNYKNALPGEEAFGHLHPA